MNALETMKWFDDRMEATFKEHTELLRQLKPTERAQAVLLLFESLHCAAAKVLVVMAGKDQYKELHWAKFAAAAISMQKQMLRTALNLPPGKTNNEEEQGHQAP